MARKKASKNGSARKKKSRAKPAKDEVHALTLLNPVDVVPYDSKREALQAYLSAIRKYPLLTPEREKELCQQYDKTQDPEIAQVLALSNLRLVVKIANDYLQSGFSLLDLIQEGNIGLLKGITEYDPYKGVKLSSYVSYWIKAYIRSFILKNWSLVKIGTTRAQRKLFYRLQKEKNKLEAMGIIPETRQLADRLEVKEKEIDEMSGRLRARDLSLDMPTRDGDETSAIIHTLSDNSQGVDELLANQEIKAEFHNRLQSFERSLSGKELVVFRDRLIAENPKTLQQIGDEYGITRERIRQIEKRVVSKMKDYMIENASFRDDIIDIN